MSTPRDPVSDDGPGATGPGERLRGHRSRRGLSVRGVAERTGLSPSFISQFERGLTNASVSSLRTLAQAVGVPMAALFEDVEPQHSVVLRAADRAEVATPGGLAKYLITRQPLQQLEIYAGEFDPGAGTGEAYVHGDSQEVFVVVAGELVVELDDVPHLLRTGDSIEYRSSTPHAVRNSSAAAATGYWISSPPSAHHQPTEETR